MDKGAPTASGSGGTAEASQEPMQPQWALLTFDSPVLAPRGAAFIGSRLDFDTNTTSCRLALHGCLVTASINAHDPNDLKRLQVCKIKKREGVVERCAACLPCLLVCRCAPVS